jgi:hypothetical protein
MNNENERTGRGPGATDAPGEPPAVQYETGKGCLIFVLIGLALAALTAAAIVLLSDPATVVAMA